MTATVDTKVSKPVQRTRVLVTDLQPGDRVQGHGTVESTCRTTGSRLTVQWEEGGYTPFPLRYMGTYVTVLS